MLLKYVSYQADIIALVLIGLMFWFGKKQEQKGKEQRTFLWMLVADIVLCVTDALTWALDGAAFAGAKVVLHTASYLLNSVSILIGVLWLVYCDFHLSTSHDSIRRHHIAYLFPWIAFQVLLLFNVKYGFMYSYDSANVYHRGPFFFLNLTMTVVYVLGSVALIAGLAVRRKRIRVKDSYELLAFVAPPLVAILCQTFIYGLSWITMGITFSLFVIFLQRTDALITKDYLTGLNNYRAFETNLDERIHTISGQDKLFVLMMDANRFKKINDTYGHSVGDEALKRIGDVLKQVCVKEDFLARLGGDEFVIVGSRRAEEEIDNLCTLINEQLDAENKNSDAPYEMSLSLGYEIFEPHLHKNGVALFNAADQKMYENKQEYHAAENQA